MNLASSLPGSSAVILLCATLAVSLPGPLRAAAQAMPRPIAVSSCEEACGITLGLEMEYGDDSGPGMLDLVGWVTAYRDVSGRTYVVGEPIDNVLVFDPGGRFLRRIGRSGSGPGELKDGASLVVTGDGEFSVLDRGRAVILNFDHTGRLRSEAKMAGWYPHGNLTFAWDGAQVIHVASLSTRDRIGFPLHLVNVETGEIERSFGSVTGEHELGGRPGVHPVAVRQDRRIWMAAGFERYDIALWDLNRPHRLLRREASWFPEQARIVPSAHEVISAPRPTITALALSGSDSLLWVAAVVADEEWMEASRLSGVGNDDFYDDILEVIDLRTNRVIASQRFDHSYHLVEAGVLGRLAVTANGSVRFQTFRIRLEADETKR